MIQNCDNCVIAIIAIGVRHAEETPRPQPALEGQAARAAAARLRMLRAVLVTLTMVLSSLGTAALASGEEVFARGEFEVHAELFQLAIARRELVSELLLRGF